jgi:hypothetical protein
MKEEKITFYNCDFCNKKFNRKDEALSCEKQHKKERDFDNMKTFELKQSHLDLLKETSIGWNDCEFGAPEIDPKRPYGNSDGVNDVAEALGIKKTKDNVEGYDKEEAKEYDDKADYLNDLEWSDKTYDYLMDIHKETQIALQIILHCQVFKLGKYILLEDGWQKWRQTK